jgi:cystathionine beta-lyase/cystathionine gamma-synthase
MNPEDICAHLGDEYDRFHGAVSPPVYQTSLFSRKRRSSGYTYSRVSNPTTEIAEAKLAALEQGEAARCFGSGMAAISSTILHFVATGSHVVAPRNVYGPVKHFLTEYLSRFGVEVSFVTGDSVEDIEAAITPETSLLYLETPSSNVFSLQDIQAIASIAKARDIPTVLDNSWATPMFQNPLVLGVDVVVHSASKYLGGHSDLIGGVAVGGQETIVSIGNQERSTLGSIMGPQDSWLLIRSLRTLPIRMKQHQHSAMAVARFLESHKKVERVLYPGLESHPQYELARRQMSGCSGLLSFVPVGGDNDIRRFTKALQLFEEGPSWGGYESILNTPGVGISVERSKTEGIPMGLVRISIGLENSESLLNDLDQGLRSL